MKSYKISFGSIFKIEDNLAEVIADEGVVINEDMVNEFHYTLLDMFQKPFCLLINKENSYSYTFQAQKKIGNLEEIKAIAVLIGTSGGLLSTETLISLKGDDVWNVNLFQDRDKALAWIETQQ